ncbi:hypothetical protein SAMN03159496_01399 [Rhizobium sp. NFR07]|jgi:hypothetical protein|uniref:hypothetical protein n=1 Tax=Rhizobium sp. NFR07 TaxID=1566262 RepID=UPI0008E88E6B|nr:hypothetical protein [Rhizobium sp. NFR07]SFB03098.1 hypothetical protein SAMN03159496_01399 [Rhizobium sp. NFR07]
MAEEWDEFSTARTRTEFRYKGMPAGTFYGDVAPTEPGIYQYMPFRSFGHYAMGRAVEAGERPVCAYESPAGTVSFEVTDRHRDGRLDLDNFTFPSGT